MHFGASIIMSPYLHQFSAVLLFFGALWDKLALFWVHIRGIFNANFSFKVLNLLYLLKYLYSYNKGRNIEGGQHPITYFA